MKEIKLKAADGTGEFSAFVYEPAAGKPPAGAVVVIQEIFGVNHHIRATADFFAAQGYLAIAPAIFDRVEKGVDLGYDGPGRQAGMAIVMKIDRDKMMLDRSEERRVGKECW